ncbi:hypothetical protein BS47DRAFT_1342130 [Hydnum rufescens UP504]|uniref:Uncharacterized protein n=1 Tax=Hydnum rufescens UP504 TaxID=1448309 RepID=A0A9P6DUC7_9AGAM|nr:hypothetical protein BS47DRAFT_1342130 [Hydnum rufescens UP504]
MSLLDLELRPGQGLGVFELGASLWNVIDLLREDKTRYPHIDVKYDNHNPSTSPIILHLRPHIDLLFSPLAQRLHTISVRRLRHLPNSTAPTTLTLRYSQHGDTLNGVGQTAGPGVVKETVVLSSPNTVLRRASVNKIFGPTYPGDTLSFPGIWFGFDEDGSTPGGIASRSISGSPPTIATVTGVHADRNAEVKRVVICQRSKEAGDTMGEIAECPAMDGELRTAIVEPRKGVKLFFYSTAHDQPLPPVYIRIGHTTSEDLLCDLGPPLRVFYKEDDRMTIHAARGPQEPDEGYFYNYFQHGIDVLLSGTTHKVRKIILHSNVPGSYQFQRYKRCPWEIHAAALPPNQAPRIASLGDRIDKIKLLFTSSKENRAPPSMVLDRSADAQNAPTLPGGVTS